MPTTRKLQKIGESLFVCLPKTWVKRLALEKGSIVELVAKPDGSITLYPKVRENHMRQTILNVGINESKRSLKRRITQAYIECFDIIKLKSAGELTDKQKEIIREIINDLFGLRITEVTSRQITIQWLLTNTPPSRDNQDHL